MSITGQDLQTLGRAAGVKAADEALEEAVKILEAHLCGRSALDHTLHMCIAEIRRLKSPRISVRQG